MRILITGAGGFVCRHIVTILCAAGHSVIALDKHFDPELRAEWSSSVETIEGDALTLPREKVDALIHGAVVTHLMPNQAPEQFFGANLYPALDAMRWARDYADRALFLSSSAVYRQTAPGPISENDPAAPLGLYATAKHTIEALVQTYQQEYGYAWAALRLSNIYGTGEFARPTRPRLSLIGQIVVDAVTLGRVTVPTYEAARDWTFAADIGHAVAALVAVPVWSHPLYNVAAEQSASPLVIADYLTKLIPGLVCKVVEQRPDDQPPLTRLGYLTNKRLFEQTGFADWTPLFDGLTQSVAWVQAQQTQPAKMVV